MNNVIIAKFSKGVYSTTAKVFRYDVGDKLQFVGLDLPDNYRVDFSNSVLGESKTVFCTSDTVEIPPEYFIPGSTIYAWIVLSQDNGRYTKYQVNIPISARAKPLDIEPTPAQKDALDEAIEALNNVAEDIQGQIDNALDEAKKSGEFDGTTIWLYDGTPVLPDYTFYKYLMRANANAVVRQFDFILLGSVLYQIISVSEFTCKAIKFVDLKGDPGQSPIVSVGKGSQGRVYIRVVGNGTDTTYYINNVLVVDFAINADSAMTEAPGKDVIKWAIDDGCTVIARIRIPSYSGGRLVLHSIPLTKWTYPEGSIGENPQLWVFEFSGRVDEEYSIRIYTEAGEDTWHFEKTGIDDELTERQVDQVLGLIENYTGRFLGNFGTKAALNSVDWVWTEEFIDDLDPLPEGSMYVSNNDYTVVQDDETQNHECWRYIYTAENGFIPQYRVNESPMTTAQLAALNSGITSGLVHAIESLLNNGLTVFTLVATQNDPDDILGGFEIVGGDSVETVHEKINSSIEKDFSIHLIISGTNKSYFVPIISFYDEAGAFESYWSLIDDQVKIDIRGFGVNSPWVIGVEDPINSIWDTIGSIWDELDGKLDKNQGTGNAGKVLTVGSDGSVTPQDISGGNDNVFIAQYGATTQAELEAAYQAGKAIYCEYVNPNNNDVVYRLSFFGRFEYDPARTEKIFRFSGTDESNDGSIMQYLVSCGGGDGGYDGWQIERLSSPLPRPAGNPSPLGTANPGSMDWYSRHDHVHPMPSASDVGAVAANQGAANANKVLTVNSSGVVVPEDNRFVVTFTPTSPDYSGTIDKTPADIADAYEARKRIIAYAPAFNFRCELSLATIQSGGLYTFDFIALGELNGQDIMLRLLTSDSTSTFTTKIYPLASGQWTGGSY